MSRTLKYNLILIFGLMLFSAPVVAQVSDDIIFSLKTGNASKLAKHFSDNVELMVLESENVYSKAHAQQVMSDFFKKYPPSNFTIIHQGGKDDSSYAIGTLKVENNKFRVYFLIKEKGGASYIHQLRIERQTN
ncbi:MAG TPA: DUF4783 domain-containing protein [Prolixibacteraceae bacterium]|nr:DUF4783 domain-containing protein [Prolixibacteraceae bacterium]